MLRIPAYAAPLLALSLLGPVSALSGCGGGGGQSTDGGSAHVASGRVQFKVDWASGSRMVPSNAQSIEFQVKDGAQLIRRTVIVRPASTTMIDSVPVGSYTVRAAAFASTDATGVSLASAEVPTTVTDGGISNISLTLASAIDHLEYSPNPFLIGAGLTQNLTVTAKDAGGNVVLLDSGALTYLSSNTGLFTVSATGVVTASGTLGSGTLTVTEGNSGQTLTIPAAVKVGVVVSPPATTVNVGGTASFAATVTGTATTSVTWSVRESGGGTVSAAGVYTAPSQRGTYHVDATSNADNTRKGSAIVTVTSGQINAEVH